MTGGPSPDSRTKIAVPAASTVRSLTVSMASFNITLSALTKKCLLGAEFGSVESRRDGTRQVGRRAARDARKGGARHRAPRRARAHLARTNGRARRPRRELDRPAGFVERLRDRRGLHAAAPLRAREDG